MLSESQTLNENEAPMFNFNTPPSTPSRNRSAATLQPRNVSRSDTIRNIIRRGRTIETHCEYCNEDTHTISMCNCPELATFVELVQTQIEEHIMSIDGSFITVNDVVEAFKMDVNTWTTRNIKAYCVRALNIPTHYRSIDDCKNLIVGDFKFNVEHSINVGLLNSPLIVTSPIPMPSFIDYYAADAIANNLSFAMLHNEMTQIDADHNLRPEFIAHNGSMVEEDRIPDNLIVLEKNPENENDSEEECKDKDCPVCFNQINHCDQVVFNCSHHLCGECVTNIARHSTSNCISCPLCRANVHTIKYNSIDCANKIREYKNNI